MFSLYMGHKGVIVPKSWLKSKTESLGLTLFFFFTDWRVRVRDRRGEIEVDWIVGELRRQVVQLNRTNHISGDLSSAWPHYNFERVLSLQAAICNPIRFS